MNKARYRWAGVFSREIHRWFRLTGRKIRRKIWKKVNRRRKVFYAHRHRSAKKKKIKQKNQWRRSYFSVGLNHFDWSMRSDVVEKGLRWSSLSNHRIRCRNPSLTRFSIWNTSMSVTRGRLLPWIIEWKLSSCRLTSLVGEKDAWRNAQNRFYWWDRIPFDLFSALITERNVTNKCRVESLFPVGLRVSLSFTSTPKDKESQMGQITALITFYSSSRLHREHSELENASLSNLDSVRWQVKC